MNMSTISNKKMNSVMAIMGIFALALIPDIAMAAPWDSTATKVLEIFTGGMTRTIAIIAVIACGIAAMAGKLSWDWAIKIIVGIVLIFGAAAIVDYVISAASA
ncbi:Conjugal transfer protein (fragment) [Candidatus Methylobacter favarea]|uniref:Conjugal transfer protein n=1 Tax=Candidatus Methylobacter favarea TaxID=2707345 RepID=A0A8S0WIU1_9GAMM